MRSIHLSILICIFNILTGVAVLVSNQSWLADSGLCFVTDKPIIISLLSIFIFSFMIICEICYYFSGVSLFYYISVVISTISCTIVFAYSAVWILKPRVFFSSLSKSWNDLLSTDRLLPVESRLKCCGFEDPSQFPELQCAESATRACLSVLLKNYTMNVVGNGLILMANCVSVVVSVSIFAAFRRASQSLGL